MIVRPAPPNRAEALELVRIYRDSAHRYDSLRANATYLNLAATGAVTLVLAANLLHVEGGCVPLFLDSHVAVYLIACVILCALGGWATAIASTFTNSICRYMQMATELEIKILGVSYKRYRIPGIGVTPEFVPGLLAEVRSQFSGNIWNLINVSVPCYAMFIAAAVGYNMNNHELGHTIFSFGATFYGLMLYFLLKTAVPLKNRKPSNRLRALKYRALWSLLFLVPPSLFFICETWLVGISPWAPTAVHCQSALNQMRQVQMIDENLLITSVDRVHREMRMLKLAVFLHTYPMG